ncbi:MAG TPA: hypothetical protein PLX15_01385 [Candidatus Woesearchaeota archaeon]|mgnify:CR=1 FL=1|nr:hypothetical protein [Candidatus Woesearchaeota archaeon]
MKCEEKELKKKLVFEIKRKIVHIFLGVLIIYFLSAGVIDDFTLFVVLVCSIFVSICSKYIHVPIWDQILQRFDRPESRRNFPGRGFIYFIAGALLSIKLFPQDIAFASIMIVTIGDSASCIFGMSYKLITRKNGNKKELFGTFSALLLSLGFAMIFVGFKEALIASAIALFAEFAEFRLNKQKIDDNLVVPLVAGTTILLIRKFFL